MILCENISGGRVIKGMETMFNRLAKVATGFVLFLGIAGYCYAIEPIFNHENEKITVYVDLGIVVSANPNPVFLDVEQTDFIRTQADGFSETWPSNPARYRKIGTTYLTWQSRGLYEIVIYTDNINRLGLNSKLPAETESPTEKANTVDLFTGLHLLYPWEQWVQTSPEWPLWRYQFGRPRFWPMKVWVPKTAGLVNIGTESEPNYVPQLTAPVNPDGSINTEYYNGGTGYNPEPSFGYIPEKMAVNTALPVESALYGSYKKVIASIFDKTWPPRIELTFAIDLANETLAFNADLELYQYEGTVIIHLIGN